MFSIESRMDCLEELRQAEVSINAGLSFVREGIETAERAAGELEGVAEPGVNRDALNAIIVRLKAAMDDLDDANAALDRMIEAARPESDAA